MTRLAHRGAVQHGLRRLYERLGARLVLWLLVAAWTVTFVTTYLMALAADRYIDFGGDFLWILGFAEICALAGPGLVVFRARRSVRAILAWSGDARTSANAPAAWHAVAAYPREIVRHAVPVGAGLVAIAIVVVAPRLDIPVWALAPTALALFVSVAGAVVVTVFGIEFTLRPMLEDIAAYLPPDFEPAYTGWTLHTKALAPLPVVTMVATVGVGAFGDVGSTGAERLAFTLALAVVLVAVATAIFFIITRSILDPIGELTAATQRVRAGDLSAMVPVVTADDLGRLAASFNQMLGDLRESRARIVAASDAARRKVERDLHDGAQQSLVLLNLKLGLLRRAVAADPEAAAMADDAREELARALAELRDLAHGIYPAVLENEGLAPALADAVGRAGIPAGMECDGAGRYPRDVEAAVYFCCLEALQNAAKHAGEEARATVRLRERDGALEFEVADDGAGFDVSPEAASAGVQNMTDRIGAVGGTLLIHSAPGAGATVSGRVPLSDAHRNVLPSPR